ncbi:MAG TPA: hypothetical protein VHX14_11250 [Thermoanaerobaculia bacterium]|nr:hypothetical protein [Thermoanaerobaculia bacterium]
MAIEFYGLTITVNGAASATAYYSVSLASGGEFVQGGATLYPTAIGATFVSLYGIELSINAPAGKVSGAATLTTTGDIVAGRITISPPINVDTVVALYGTSEIASVTVKAGEPGGAFAWTVSGNPGVSGTPKSFLDNAMQKPA